MSVLGVVSSLGLGQSIRHLHQCFHFISLEERKTAWVTTWCLLPMISSRNPTLRLPLGSVYTRSILFI